MGSASVPGFVLVACAISSLAMGSVSVPGFML